MKIRMLFQVFLYHLGFVCAGLVPNQKDRFFDMTTEMFQSNNQLFGIHRTIKMAFIDFARNRQSNHGRSFPAILTDAFEDWGLATRCPGEADRLCIRQAKLIFKHDLCVEPLRFFLSWTNPCSTRLGSVLRHVLWLWDQVFGHSNPGHPASG